MYNPPKGVRTPLAELTDVREKDPVTGNDDAKEPIMLLIPMAIISWLASTLFPLAVSDLKKIINKCLSKQMKQSYLLERPKYYALCTK